MEQIPVLYLLILHILYLNYLVPGSAHDGGKDGAGCVIASEASLAHARPIVNHQRSNLVVTHSARTGQ